MIELAYRRGVSCTASFPGKFCSETLVRIVAKNDWAMEVMKVKAIYKWLIDRNAFSGIISSVVFPLILVPTLLWFLNRKPTDSERVCINVPAALADYPFYIRYVREGVGGWTPGNPLFRDDYLLVDSGSIDNGVTRTKCRTITFTRHYGAQFKPFLSLGGKTMSFDEASKLLSDAGFYEISPDAVPQIRNVWFLSRKYVRVEDVGNGIGAKIFNNFVAK